MQPIERITQQDKVRALFWREVTGGRRKPYKWTGKTQSELPPRIAAAWERFIDRLKKEGVISEQLAQRVTL